ncbi:MAG: YciI family protein [Calditrichaeota bacterium]|nr:YciI family protein [Calditrichota bacterium]
MRVMVIIKATKNSEAGIMPSENLLTDMMKYNEELVDSLINDAAKSEISTVTVHHVIMNKNKKSVVDGPFAETKELIAGFWLWKVKSMDEAIEWVKRCPEPMPGEEALIEIRPVFEMDDFGDHATPEVREQEARLREKTAKQ